MTTNVLHSEGKVLYLAIECSNKTWRLRFGNGQRVRDQVVSAWDRRGFEAGVLAAKKRLVGAGDVGVRSCYEAGRDGFSIHRYLTSLKIENLVVDPASIAVDRRAKHVKTDRLDAIRLLDLLVGYWRDGEKRKWRVCRVPSQETEDNRRVEREREHLVKERTRLAARIRSLLVLEGIRVRDVEDISVADLRGVDGQPLMPRLQAELTRLLDHWGLIGEHIRTVEKVWRETVKTERDAWGKMAGKLQRLRGLGEGGTLVLVSEFFGWRRFDNRRQVGSAAGLTGTPYNSGDQVRDQGISKAGNRRIRAVMVELAWQWLRFQPQSALARWYQTRFGPSNRRNRRVGIVALARKLLVALWKYLTFDEVPAGAILRA